jgi:hypothetical protein
MPDLISQELNVRIYRGGGGGAAAGSKRGTAAPILLSSKKDLKVARVVCGLAEIALKRLDEE